MWFVERGHVWWKLHYVSRSINPYFESQTQSFLLLVVSANKGKGPHPGKWRIMNRFKEYWLSFEEQESSFSRSMGDAWRLK